ncbi:MAG: hypothetical protein M8467_12915 [Anaerolineae bacterium]|nr:hypothetical protein [Anaerolineae bacterium]
MDLGVWRDISLMWLVFLTFIAVLPVGIVLFFAIKAMRRLRQITKLYLPVAQDKARLVATRSEEISQKIAEPVIKTYAKTAQVNTIAKSIRRRNGT